MKAISTLLCLAVAIPEAFGRSLYSVDRPRPKARADDPMMRSAFLQARAPENADVVRTMKPLRGSGGVDKPRGSGQAMNDVGLKDEIVLAWREEESEVDAELTASWNEMPNVKVINMEDFADAVDDVDCSAPHMYIDFSASSVYNTAKQTWKWVNEDEDNNIVIFANHPNCTTDGSREPYIVTSTAFDDAKARVDFTVEQVNSYDDFLDDAELDYYTWVEPDEALLAEVWNQTAQNVKETNVGFEKREMAERAQKNKRDGVQISVNQRFDGEEIFKFTADNETDSGVAVSGSISLICKTCGTRGRIRIQGKVKWAAFIPTQAYVEFVAADVQAEVILQLLLELSINKAGHYPAFQLGASVEVGKLFEASLLLGIGVGYEWSIEAVGSVEFGTTGKMQDGIHRTCFWGCKSSKTGWSWSWEEHPFTVEGEIKVSTDIYMYINAQAGIKILGYGFSGGVAALAPKFMAELTAEGTSAGGICGHPNVTVGVSLKVDIGIEIYLYSGNDFQDTDQEWPLFVWELNLMDRCWPLKTSSGSALTFQAGVTACQYFNSPVVKPWKSTTPQSFKTQYMTYLSNAKAGCNAWKFRDALSWCLAAEVARSGNERNYAAYAAGVENPLTYPWDYEKGMFARCAALARLVPEQEKRVPMLEAAFKRIDDEMAVFYRTQEPNIRRDDFNIYQDAAFMHPSVGGPTVRLCYQSPWLMWYRGYLVLTGAASRPTAFATEDIFRSKMLASLRNTRSQCKIMGDASTMIPQELAAHDSCTRIMEEAWNTLLKNTAVAPEIKYHIQKMNDWCGRGSRFEKGAWEAASSECLVFSSKLQQSGGWIETTKICTDMRDWEIYQHGKPVDIAVDACKILTANESFRTVTDKFAQFTAACTTSNFRKAAEVCAETKPQNNWNKLNARLEYQCTRLGNAAGTGLVASS